jgi:hypothetical protein
MPLRTLLCPVVACLLIAAAIPAAGQGQVTGGVMTGQVVDSTGGVLPGATVTATRLETNVVRSAITDGTGAYLIPALEPGGYRVTMALDGFASLAREGVLVELGQTVRIDGSLQVGAVQQEVTVTARSPLIDTRKTGVSTVVDRHQLDTLPINDRDYIGLSMTAPGVTSDLAPQQGVSVTSGLAFMGQSGRSNNIMVDGVDNNDAAGGAVRGLFSQESIQEFQVLMGSYSAEFGHAAGGTINIVTRSGTNTLAGNAFVFARDERLNAKEYFERFDPGGNPIDREKAPFGRSLWGGTLGGPLVRNRTFFFASFERADVTGNNFVTIDPATADLLRAENFPVELGSVPYRDDTLHLLAKVNHWWTPDSSVVVRLNLSDRTNENIERFSGTVARSAGIVQLRDEWSLAATQTDVLSSAWLNEARVQVAHADENFHGLDPGCSGLCDDDLEGGPAVQILGEARVGRNFITPTLGSERRVQVSDTVTRYGPRTTFKVGFDLSHVDNLRALPLNLGGQYIFSPLPAIPQLGLPPVSAREAFALGLPAVYVQGYGDARTQKRFMHLALFAQHERQFGSRLTVKLGLRYQKQFLPTFSYDLPGLDRPYTVQSDGNDLAPRLAVAFSPAADADTTFRAAYGIFYDMPFTGASTITDILDGGPGVRTLVVPLPGSVAAWHAPGRTLPEPGSFPSLQFAMDPEFETPYAHHTSAGLDRSLTETMSVSADFMYVRGYHQLGALDYNPLVPALGPGRRPLDVDGQPGSSASLIQFTSFGETWYRALLLNVRKRLTAGSTVTVAYTLSKSEDTSTDFQVAFGPQDQGAGRRSPTDTGWPVAFDPRLERGPGVNDQRHRLVASGSFMLPKAVQISAIVSAASGRPFNVLAGVDLNGDGDAGGAPRDRARTNPADAATSLSRNSGRLPWLATVDLRINKHVRVGDSARLELMLEAYNLFNRTNFIAVNNIFGSGAYPAEPLGTYGQFVAADTPRQLQIGIRFGF